MVDLERDDDNGVLYRTDRGEIAFRTTLNKQHLLVEARAAEQT